jgi:anti-sigma regulatory factor (Ser/Thr protein kinase)
MLATVNAERFERRDMSLPADLRRLRQAREFAEEAAADFGFDEAVQQQIKLAANEAVANAMEHGSSRDGDEIVLRAVEEEGALAIYVKDLGSFVPRMLQRGAMPERGRGLAFMDLLMDEVEVRPGSGGTEVRLLKRLED